jgi:tRNA(His) guanylyltransferase
MRIDPLGDRMKTQYENRTRISLPRRTYTIIRVDGKAFHTFTRHCEKPFDQDLASALWSAAIGLCVQAQGVCFGYVQSDEISVLLQDFATIQTDAWFDGNVQKIASVAASIVTAEFNFAYDRGVGGPALFDARVFTIPDPVEVENYFIWRQKDAERNSIQMLARCHFTDGQLRGVGSSGLHDLLHDIGINWNDLPVWQKRGVGIRKNEEGQWFVDEDTPIWTQDRKWFHGRIPGYWSSVPGLHLDLEEEAKKYSGWLKG